MQHLYTCQNHRPNEHIFDILFFFVQIMVLVIYTLMLVWFIGQKVIFWNYSALRYYLLMRYFYLFYSQNKFTEGQDTNSCGFHNILRTLGTLKQHSKLKSNHFFILYKHRARLPLRCFFSRMHKFSLWQSTKIVFKRNLSWWFSHKKCIDMQGKVWF